MPDKNVSNIFIKYYYKLMQRSKKVTVYLLFQKHK